MQTPKQQAANQRRSLMAMKEKILRLSAAWGDVDEYFMSKLASLSGEVEQMANEIHQFSIDGGFDGQQ